MRLSDTFKNRVDNHGCPWSTNISFPIMVQAGRSMKIHFGAFNCPIDGWRNTDITPHLYLARVPLLPWLLHKLGKIPAARYYDYERGAFKKLTYMNVSKRWPFADESAEA